MKYTSAEASKLLKKLEEEKSLLLTNECDCSVFNCAVGEDMDSVKPVYNFSVMQEEIEKIDEKIRIVKHAINMFNTTTVIPEFDMTVDQMLVYIPQLTRQKEKLAAMQIRQPKKRNNLMAGKNGIIDYQYANYDISEAKKACEETADLLRKAQIALDRANSVESIEIDI